MKNRTAYIILTLLIIIFAGYFLLRGDSSKNTVTGTGLEDASAPALDGNIQKITLGIKDYNYYPNKIKVQAGKPVRIYLDGSVFGCYRSFTIRDLGIAKYLPTPRDYVEFTPTESGTYGFACGMGMGRGTLIVE